MLQVNVQFIGSKVVPISFIENGREHLVRKIALQFWRRDGNRKYLCFALSTFGRDVELAWSLDDLVWQITGSAPSST
jgi:hypothetical protein